MSAKDGTSKAKENYHKVIIIGCGIAGLSSKCD